MSYQVLEYVSVQFLTKLYFYHVCLNCKKKIILPENKNLVECNHCHAIMKKTKCPKSFYAKLKVLNERGRQLPLTRFDDAVRQLVDIYNNINLEGKTANYNTATEEQIMEAVIDLDRLKVTYDDLNVTHVSV